MLGLVHGMTPYGDAWATPTVQQQLGASLLMGTYPGCWKLNGGGHRQNQARPSGSAGFNVSFQGYCIDIELGFLTNPTDGP